MIVLDEQLTGRNVEYEIAQWYRGRVCFITDLRTQTVIKDDAIPEIICQHKQSTFVTINESDFWKKVAIDARFCVVCFVLADSRVAEIPQKLRDLFSQPFFRTKAQRMGKVIRLSDQDVRFYKFNQREIKVI